MCFQGMVCVAKDLRCECIVRDSIKNFEKYEVTFPASTSVFDFINHVAEKMNHESHSFQLTMQVCGSDEKVFTVDTEGSLQSAGLSTEPGARNSLILEGRRGAIDRTAELKSPTNSEDSAITSPPPPDQFPSYQMRTLRPPTASPAAEYTFSTPLIRHETGYVGLVNPAMTCYLNSLLQALYMTPEFRNALYKWQFDTSHISNSSKCIPFQLQKLFLNLQTSTKTAVETTELTRSFGWESGEVWQQHDIQELCRVMFDALEQEFKDTEQADLINQLYQGKMIDYVKCLECDTEKSREDTFLDIPLPVRPFGSTVAYGSVEEALRAFVQPETLDGNNQYFCEVCKKKCNAHKGLKFTKFPYLLTLHLKRFDFDYSTLHRIKLNDKLVFPDVLNLNSFINNNKQSVETENETQDSIVKGDDSSITDSVLDEDTNLTTESQNNEIDQDEDEGIDLSSNSGNNHENEKNLLQNTGAAGPFMYELYSIMIHSGSASGGHYYAYIKDFSKKEWFCFNDQSVTSITYEDIKKTYGGTGGSARGYYSGAYSSSTNAYMLMYRQINKESNCYSMTEEEFPPHIKKLLDELKEAEERERALKARLEDMVRIKVYANHPMLGQPLSNKMSCHNDSTMEEVKSMAYSYLKLEGIVPEEQCRLVTYNKTQEEVEESLDGREKETLSEVFANSRSTSNIEFLLEIRDKNKKFLPYNLGDIKLSVYLYDIENQTVDGPHEIRTSPCQNLSDLKKLLQDYIPLKTDDVHIVLVKPNSLEYINNDLPLNKLGFSLAFNKVFICYKGQEGDLSATFQTSELYKLLEEVKNVITMQMSLPDTKKETLEKLLVPPLILPKTGSEEKTSDSTPTGDSLPLTNGLQEEEVGGYSSTGGGTSDQSASEDSSLTDSDRTIIGETFECTISTPCDSEQQQLPSFDKSNQINGEIDKWDLENDEPVQNYYFHASPCIEDDGQKMLKVIVDRSIGIPLLKKKLEKYVGVASKYFKLVKGSEGHEIPCSLRNCRDYERIAVKLERVLNEGEHRIKVNCLQPNSPTPVVPLFEWIVSNGESIKSIKKTLLKEVEKRACLKIPYERCRLRKQSFKNPGPVLLVTDVWDELFRVSHQYEVYLQELNGPEPVTDSSQVILFARRWYPSQLTLGPFEEIVFDSESSTSIGQKLVEMSDIPAEHLRYARGKLPFPAETSVQNLTDLNWESESESKSVVFDWAKDDGSVIFYRNDKEEMKRLSKEEQQEMNSQETNNTSSTTSSYISSYSPRRERALKIYLDTTSRRTRSAVDVD